MWRHLCSLAFPSLSSRTREASLALALEPYHMLAAPHASFTHAHMTPPRPRARLRPTAASPAASPALIRRLLCGGDRAAALGRLDLRANA